MLCAKEQFKSKRNQVNWLMQQLPPKTRDGAKYSRLSVGLALDDFDY
jgi:hypothetical protein